ncbi:hypothetical protein GIB67_033876, partial [Kingdonia uniflora]
MKPSETDIQQGLVQEVMINQIEAPTIGVVPAIGSSSSATEIEAIVVRVCSQLKEHGKMFHNHGKMLERILMYTVGDSTLPLRDTPLLGQYQFSTPKKITKHKREGGKGKWHKKSNANKKNKKAEEVDVPLKKKVESTKKEAFTDEQFDHVPLIQLKTLIPKIPKKGLANRVPRKRRAKFPELENIQSTAENLLQQVAPGEGLEVVKDLMVDDDVEMNLEAISSEYCGGLLKASADQTTVVSAKEQTLEVRKTEDEASQSVYLLASTDQTTIASIEEQTIKVVQTNVVISHQEEDVGETSQSKESKKEVEHNKEEVVERKVDDDGNSQNKPDSKQLEVDVTLKKRHALTEDKINERVFIMVCRMNQLYAHLYDLLLGVLLESFIQRPIFQDEKNQVDQVWSLRKDELSPEAKKDNRSTYMMIGKEIVYLNALYTVYPKQWLNIK